MAFSAWELSGDNLTGNKLSFIVNPEKHMSQRVIDIHGITNEQAAEKPYFAEVAGEIRHFLQISRLVVFCPPYDEGNVDSFFLNKELELAGFSSIPQEQFLNAHTMSKALHKNASLDGLLDYYKIDRSKRITEGHSAELDAQLLGLVFPSLHEDYRSLKSQPAYTGGFPNAHVMASLIQKLNLDLN